MNIKYNYSSYCQRIFIKIHDANIPSLITQLEKIWKERVPNRPFEYHFMDEDYDNLYVAEQRTADDVLNSVAHARPPRSVDQAHIPSRPQCLAVTRAHETGLAARQRPGVSPVAVCPTRGRSR